MAFRSREERPYPGLAADLESIGQEADAYLAGTTFDYPKATHNAHLVRARIMQRRVLVLLTQWERTGKAAYRRAALAHIERMGRWSYWSWVLWRKRDPRPDAIFDLSYGENAATLAFAWDWLYPSLNGEEKAMMLAIARRWPFASFRNLSREEMKQWFCRPDSNWNAVCAGGLGLLALAMMEDAPEAAMILAGAEESIVPYMQFLQTHRGGWPEGIGYWGYGMRYAFLYLLSWEKATGRKHPLMGLSGVRRTVDFPLDLLPNGVPCSFGDVNRYLVHPFHYALAERLGRGDIVRSLDHLRKTEEGGFHPYWPTAVERLLFHPRKTGSAVKAARRVTRQYKHLDWFFLSDRWPNPKLYLSIRGGTTEVPHSHLDLTSFHCAVGDEALIVNLGPTEYLDTTFGPRRWELFEMTPASKNIVLVNGVGIQRPARVVSKTLSFGGFPALRLDATEAMGRMRDGPVMKFYGRLFILFDDKAALILDRIELKQFGRSEARFHTFGRISQGESTVRIQGARQAAGLSFASDIPCELREATDALTSPGPQTRVIRWGTQDLHRTMTLATLITPGGEPGEIRLQSRGRLIELVLRAPGLRRRLTLTSRLLTK